MFLERVDIGSPKNGGERAVFPLGFTDTRTSGFGSFQFPVAFHLGYVLTHLLHISPFGSLGAAFEVQLRDIATLQAAIDQAKARSRGSRRFDARETRIRTPSTSSEASGVFGAGGGMLRICSWDFNCGGIGWTCWWTLCQHGRASVPIKHVSGVFLVKHHGEVPF